MPSSGGGLNGRARDPADCPDEFGPGGEIAARAGVRAAFESPGLERFLDDPRGDLVAGVFDREVRDWLGAETRVVHLTDRIMRKQKGQWRKQKRGGGRQYKGHELSAAEYRLLPRLVGEPQVVIRYMPSRRISRERLALRLNLVSEHDGVDYNLVIGRLPDRPAAVRVISFHQLDNGRAQTVGMIQRAVTGDYGQSVLRNSLAMPR